MMRNVGNRFVVLACLIAVVACGGGSPQGFLSIGTGGTGGVYYPLGGALTSRLSAVDSTNRYTAEVTGGSVENVNRVANGEMDLGFTMAITMFEAYRGGADFAQPVTNLRAVAPLYPNFVHVVLARNSTVGNVAELAGKTVSVGSAGSGTEQAARQLLESYGVTYDDLRTRFLSFRESSDALRDGSIDAAIIAAGYPAAAVLEATTGADARVLSLDSAGVARLMEQYPYYDGGEIPGGVYPGNSDPIYTLTVMNWLVASDRASDEVIGHVLRVLQDDRDALVQVHEIARQIDLTPLFRAPIPLHPSAEGWRDTHLTRR